MYMSPSPHVPAPGRVETNISDRPRTGVGQKSATLGMLIGASSLRGASKGELMLARSAAQMSFGSPPRLDANSRLNPSAVSIGQPSAAAGSLTPFSTFTAVPQVGSLAPKGQS